LAQLFESAGGREGVSVGGGGVDSVSVGLGLLHREVESTVGSIQRLAGFADRLSEAAASDDAGSAVLAFEVREGAAGVDDVSSGGNDGDFIGLGDVHGVADSLVGGGERVDGFGLDLASEGLQFSADGDGRDVGGVVGEDVLEDVAGGADVGFVGDDGEVVGGSAAGGADVEGAVAGRQGDQRVADIDGVALVGVGGGGVAEAQMGLCVVGGDGDGALSPLSGQGEAPVDVDGVDSPELAVADGFVVVGAQGAVVAAGHDEVAGAGGLASADRGCELFVEVAEVAAGVLETGQTVCVETEAEDDDAQPGQVCGSDVQGAVDAAVAVGDGVVGEIVYVELDPKSGAHWSLWTHLAETPE
jgi:hypothetical protein